MNQINFANINLGMELSPSFHKHAQEGLLERLSAMLKGLTNNAAGIVILDGCVMTKVGDQYDQTAGVVYYQGEILTVDAFSGNHAVQIPVYQAATTTYTQQAWYGDGVKRDTFFTKKLPMAMAAAGSGIADYTAVTRIENIKANKAQGVWTPINLINGWINSGASGIAEYLIDQFGQVHLRGRITKDSGAGNDFCDNLPSHPTRNSRYYIPHEDDVYQLSVIGSTSIGSIFPAPPVATNIYIEGSYWTH